MRVHGLALTMAGLSLMPLGVRADEKGDELLKASFSKLHSAKTFSAKVEQTVAGPNGERKSKGTILAMKPNFFRFELEGKDAPVYVSDGKSYFVYQSGRPSFQKIPVEPEAKQMFGPWEGEVDAFFGGAAAGEKSESSITGEEKVNGIDCRLLTVKMTMPDRTVTYAIGKDDMRIHRSALVIPLPDGGSIKQTNVLTDIKLDAPKKASDFAFKPPAGVKEMVRQDPAANLVAVGKKAPEFSLPTATGSTISLKEGLNRKKALLINFWFYN
jgi:outer membrane lipoprotein-sorting protein